MKDNIDRIILEPAYTEIERSTAKRVAGSTIWEKIRCNPGVVPGRLRRLVSLGLLEKDHANSSSRTKVYAPTDAGCQMWQRIGAVSEIA